MLAIVGRWFPLAAGGEFSVEANPIDVSPAVVDLLADAGVNRISLGGQSFDAAKLKLLERDHSPEMLRARRATVAAADRLGIARFDFWQCPANRSPVWQRDLAEALALAPDHVSTYGLTFERGTSFWSRLEHRQLARLDEETERSMYATAIDTLTAAGLEHYEVSNFARAGHACRHNQAYWSGAGYYAVGPGAARYVDGRREMNHRSTTTWLKRVLAGQSPVAESECLSPRRSRPRGARVRPASPGRRRAGILSPGDRPRDRLACRP